MFDAAVINENGIDSWRNPCSNRINNGYSTAKLFYATAIGVCRKNDFDTLKFFKDAGFDYIECNFGELFGIREDALKSIEVLRNFK